MSWLELDDHHLLRADRIIVVANANLAAGKRLLASVKGTRFQVELTAGRRRRTLLLLDTGHVVISALPVADIRQRLAQSGGWSQPAAQDGAAEP